MNINLLKAALKIIPRKNQGKALEKALNFLFSKSGVSFDGFRTLQLEIQDLKKSWFFSIDEAEFKLIGRKCSTDILVRSTFPVILSSEDCTQLQLSVESEEIEIIANSCDKVVLKNGIKKIEQARVDALVERCYSFLRLKRKPRFDIKKLTISDIKTSRDVEWVRDTAVYLEKDNLLDALRLMELAHQARPSSPFIKRKVEEYRQALSSNIEE